MTLIFNLKHKVRQTEGIKINMTLIYWELQAADKELEAALDSALETGYRHIDTAYVYENEAAIGRVLAKWLSSGKVKREDLFIVTKVRSKFSEDRAVSCQPKHHIIKTSRWCGNRCFISSWLFAFCISGTASLDFTTSICVCYA
jgi:predicted oxidoreductase